MDLTRLDLRHIFSFLLIFLSILFFTQPSYALVLTWDGEGATNDWSDCDNWTTNTCPDDDDVATFDGTSTKDATIDGTHGGIVDGLDVNSGYTGTITQNRDMTYENSGFALADGTYVTGTSGNITFTNGANITIESGVTFTHDKGIVTFTGTGENDVNLAFDAITVNRLVVNKSDGTNLDMDGSFGLYVADDATFTDGQLKGTWIRVQSDVFIDPTFDGSTGTPEGRIYFTGSNASRFFIDSTANVPGFIIDNANFAGTVLTSGSAMNVIGPVIIKNGNFDFGSGGDTIIFGESVVVSGGSLSFSNNILSLATSATFHLNGGTFNLNTSSFVSNGNITIDAGTFNMNSGQLFLRGDANWTHTSGGTLSSSTSTLTFSGTGTNNVDIDTGSTTDADTFYNMTVNKTSGTVEFNAGDGFEIENDLTLVNGLVTATTNQFNIDGDLTASATADSFTCMTMGFRGTGDQTINLSSAFDVIDCNIFSVVKFSGAVNLDSPLTLDEDGQFINISVGTFDLNGQNLTVDNSANDGILSVEADGIFRLQGNEIITFDRTPLFDSGSTIYYDGTGASYTLQDYTPSNLVISGGANSVFTIPEPVFVRNNLTIENSTLSLDGKELSVDGTFSNTGTLRMVGVEYPTFANDTDSGTVEFVGDADASADSFFLTEWDYFNLHINFTDSDDTLGTSFNTSNSLDDNLIHHLELNDGTGSATAADSSGNGFTGTLTNFNTATAWVSGSSSITFANTGALDFDGADDHIVLTGAIYDGVYDTRTISVWFRADDTSGTQVLFEEGDTTDGLNLYLEDSKLYAGAWISGTGDFFISSQENINNNRWYHAAITYDKDGFFKLYVNGIFQGSESTGVQMPARSDSDAIGASINTKLHTGDSAGTGNYFDGQIDDFRVYNASRVPFSIKKLSEGLNTDSVSLTSTDVNGDLYALRGTFTAPATLTIAGDVSSNGTFANNSGTVVLDGANQSLLGGSISFYNLTKTTSSAETLTFTAGTTITISNEVTFAGSAGNLLSLRSSNPGSQYNLVNNGSRSMTYLDIQDSQNLSTLLLNCYTDCTNSGNNVSWSFSAPTISFTTSSSSDDEDAGTVNIQVTLSALSGQDITVDYNVTGGTATGSGTDYTLTSGTLTISAGSLTNNINLSLTDDGLEESDETIQVVIQNPTIASLGATTSFTFTITDDDSSSLGTLTLTQSGGTTSVTEGGATDTFTLVLNSLPTADVVVNISNDSDATTDLSSLIFTTANWNQTQTITITAVDDDFAEGNHSSNISFSVTSSDGNYNGASLANLLSTVIDNDSVGVSVSHTSGNTSVTENGTSDSYNIVLTSAPFGDVTISLALNNQITVSDSSLLFDPSNWDTPQSITVTAVNDSLQEGDHSMSIVHSIASTDDSDYNALSVDPLTVNITDDDVVSLSVSQSGGSTRINTAGLKDNYSLRLSTRPESDVTVSISAPDNISLSSNSITFTKNNWDQFQDVIVSYDDSGTYSESATITHSLSSADSSYNSISANSVIVTIDEVTQNSEESESQTLSVNLTLTPSLVKEQKPVTLLVDISDPLNREFQKIWTQNSGTALVLTPTENAVVFSAPQYNSSNKSLNSISLNLSLYYQGQPVASLDYNFDVLQSEIDLSADNGTNTQSVEGVSKGIDNLGQILKEQFEDFNGLTRHFLSLDKQKFYFDKSVFGEVNTLQKDNYIYFGFPEYSANRGLVIRIDLNKITGSFDITSQLNLSIDGFSKLFGTKVNSYLGESMKFGDADNDGVEQLMILQSTIDYGYLYIFENDNFTVASIIQGTKDYQLMSSEFLSDDFNGNGRVELVLLTKNSRSEYNLIGFELTELADFLIEELGFDYTVAQPSAIRFLKKGDINGDGIPDLINIYQDSCDLNFTFGGFDLIGNLESVDKTISCSENIDALEIGDLSGDGIDDLVLGSHTGNSNRGLIAVFAGQENWDDITFEDGIFLYGENVAEPIGEKILLGDIDKDGSLEIVSSEGEENSKIIEFANQNAQSLASASSGVSSVFGCQLQKQKPKSKIPFEILSLFFINLILYQKI